MWKKLNLFPFLSCSFIFEEEKKKLGDLNMESLNWLIRGIVLFFEFGKNQKS
uniref:Uncharacterized protein n=1 Tax=Rhizophora mucronata TaxID=61149 RepID=A0A2P2NXH9_RHIMU